MFILKGNFSEEFDTIFQISKKISNSDPLHFMDKNLPSNHLDGWGFVNLSDHDVTYFRTDLPLADAYPRGVENGYLLFHMRNAARGEPMGIQNSHPFHISTEDGDFYLIHNGWFDKEKIANFMGLKNYKNENDSLVFLRFLVSINGKVEERIQESIRISLDKEFIKSTANIMLLFIDKLGKAKGFALSEASRTTNYGKYHELYMMETDSWKGVFSSSFLEFEQLRKLGKVTKLERGRLYEI